MRKGRRLFAVYIRKPVFPRRLRRDLYASGFLHAPLVAGERADGSAGKLGRFRVGKIKVRRRPQDAFRADKAGINRDYADPVAAQFMGHRPRHLVCGGFCHRVGDAFVRFVRRPEGQVENSAARVQHVRHCEPACHVMRPHAGRHHVVVAGSGRVPESALFPERRAVAVIFIAAPDVVDENVNAPAVADDGIDGVLRLRLVRMVAPDGEAEPARVPYGLFRLRQRAGQGSPFKFVHCPAGKIHGRARLCQGDGDPFAESPRRAGDKGRPALQGASACGVRHVSFSFAPSASSFSFFATAFAVRTGSPSCR